MKVIKNIAVYLILSLFLSFAFVKPSSAPTKPSIKIEPMNYTGKAGSTFDVKLNIYDAGEYMIDNTDVYAWQVMIVWDPALLEITAYDVIFGTFMDTPRIGSWGLLTADAVPSSFPQYVYVTDGFKFALPGGWGGKVLIQDDYNSEINTVQYQDGNRLTLQNTLTHTYTVAAGGGVYPWPLLERSATPGPAGNRISLGETTKGAPPGVSGSGWLATLTFNCKAKGTTTLDIDAPTFGAFTYITNTLGEYIGDDPSGDGDPGNYQKELLKQSGYFILPWDEDINADGAVDIFDLCTVAVWWGQDVPPAPEEADINGDYHIDVTDLSLVSIEFGTYANV